MAPRHVNDIDKAAIDATADLQADLDEAILIVAIEDAVELAQRQDIPLEGLLYRVDAAWHNAIYRNELRNAAG
jgi:hypothetical protein